ncbi:unnamed protein product [Soboliphyme baturini]|uniref:Protein salvador homolog 1 n=1 Tax=Soboliphyme baturini TaxID=241478 RepID=A0A183J3H4_9BILA|nr:unnamed protein product [Soboliphyme baturini]
MRRVYRTYVRDLISPATRQMRSIYYKLPQIEIQRSSCVPPEPLPVNGPSRATDYGRVGRQRLTWPPPPGFLCPSGATVKSGGRAAINCICGVAQHGRFHKGSLETTEALPCLNADQ